MRKTMAAIIIVAMVTRPITSTTGPIAAGVSLRILLPHPTLRAVSFSFSLASHSTIRNFCFAMPPAKPGLPTLQAD